MIGSKERIVQCPEVMSIMFNWLHLTNACAIPTHTLVQIPHVNHILHLHFLVCYHFEFCLTTPKMLNQIVNWWPSTNWLAVAKGKKMECEVLNQWHMFSYSHWSEKLYISVLYKMYYINRYKTGWNFLCLYTTDKQKILLDAILKKSNIWQFPWNCFQNYKKRAKLFFFNKDIKREKYGVSKDLFFSKKKKKRNENLQAIVN